MQLTVFHHPDDASAWCAAARARGASIGFVPTMGALHEGHLELVRRAVAENDVACVSVFVNPLQFNQPSDFERYPRDLDADTRLLDSVACSMLFTGALGDFFAGASTTADVELLDAGPEALGLEGEHRPGHFDGVATIVARLFEVTAPTRAYFGEKDYQQTLVVRRLARERGGPDVVVCPTSREADGLARSSRNALLDARARSEATVLSRALFGARDAWRGGERDADALTRVLRAPLDSTRVDVEYAELRDPEAWGTARPSGRMTRARALVAANVGGVRLIDNLALDDHEEAP